MTIWPGKRAQSRAHVRVPRAGAEDLRSSRALLQPTQVTMPVRIDTMLANTARLAL